MDNAAVDVRQAPLQPIVVVSQSFMVDSYQVQHRRMDIVNRKRILLRLVSEVIGRSIGHATAHPPTGKPDRKPFRIMIAASISQLEHRHPTELRAAHDQRLLQQPTLFQILQQARYRLIQDLGVPGNQLWHAVVGVPVTTPARRIRTVEELHEAGATFAPKALLTSTTPARDIEIVDMDGDGVNDLVVFSGVADQVQIFINENTRLQDPPRAPTAVVARDVPRDLGGQIEITWEAPDLGEVTQVAVVHDGLGPTTDWFLEQLTLSCAGGRPRGESGEEASDLPSSDPLTPRAAPAAAVAD